jgi:hypothetical protein
MAEKHIFIGLGGSGVNTVALIKYKIYERIQATSMQSRRQIMDLTYRFMFVDTDSEDVNKNNNKYRSLYEGGTVDFIDPLNELVNLGDLNPYIIYREAKQDADDKINRRIVEACPDLVADSMDNRNLSFGAGAIRMKSRIAFARKEADFTSMLERNITDLNQVQNAQGTQNVIYYWVIASSNGGTGSGTLHDVLYLVNMVHKLKVNPGDPKVGLILYMPRLYMSLNGDNDKYPRNAYALFKEVEAFESWGKSKGESSLKYHRLAMSDYPLLNPNMPYRPFEFCIPVDFHTDDANNLGDKNKMYSNVAEMLFYIHSGQGARGFTSFLDNNQDGSISFGNDSFLVPMGYMAIRKPLEEFENYMSLRFKYEMLRYGILGDPVEGVEERKAIVQPLFDSLIKSRLFPSGASTQVSFFTKIRAKAEQVMDEDMPQALLLGSDEKPVNQLPAGVSQSVAEGIVDQVRAAISNLDIERRRTQEELDNALWRWTEDNTRKWGLKYVESILLDLDTYCSDLYQSYCDGLDTNKLNAIGVKSKDVLEKNVCDIEEGLEDLAAKATEVTLRERALKKNADDIYNYYKALKDWVYAQVNQLVTEEAFQMLNHLCIGDNGTIDLINQHIRGLMAGATTALIGKDGAAKNYSELARTFLNKKQDVTSVFVPDITMYADSGGWLEDGNLFSGWYRRIIDHGDSYESGKGYRPLRMGDQLASLEGFFGKMIVSNKNQMIQNGYVVIRMDENRKEQMESRLFVNTSIPDDSRVIEDLLSYADHTLKMLLHQDGVINSEWYGKSLSQFYTGLPSEVQLAIKRRTQPPLFFPYNRERASKAKRQKSFCVGPMGIVNTAFSTTGDTEFLPSQDDSVMYKVVTKVGLALSYYDLYGSLKREYDECTNKVFYHFHQAFAMSGGNPDQIRLPREITPEEIVLAKYLLMNSMGEDLKDIFRKGTAGSYDAKHFVRTPVIMRKGANIVKFATTASFGVYEQEKVELRLTDGREEFFHTAVIDHPDRFYTELLRSFRAYYTTGQFEQLIAQLIKSCHYLVPDKVRSRFSAVRDQLKAELTTVWNSAGKVEKETVGDLLSILDTRLNTFEKFLSEKLR